MIYNSRVTGLDEAAFLIALGFPFKTVSKIETVDLESQKRDDVPDRLSWQFGDVSARGEHIERYRAWFKLPAPNQKIVNLAQRAAVAACNYQALKDCLLHESPLCQKFGNGWVLLKNRVGKMLPRQHCAPLSSWCGTSAAIAISAAFGSKLESYSLSAGRLYGIPEPAEPGALTPQKVELFYLSSAPADPNDYSDLSVLCAMFVMRGELLKVASKNRRLSLHLGRKNALISADASEKVKDKVFRFLTNGR